MNKKISFLKAMREMAVKREKIKIKYMLVILVQAN